MNDGLGKVTDKNAINLSVKVFRNPKISKK